MQNSSYVIRACEPADCASIASLGRSVWGEWANGQPLPRQLIELNHPVFVAQSLQNEIVGYGVGVAEAFGPGGWVLSVTIAPGWRGMGIGIELRKL